MLTTIIVFVVVLGVLVLVHEFGHFITAKRAGLAVEEFGFGFPPRLFSFKRGGTRYSLNLIPFGGFVKILGEDGGNTDDRHSFASRGVGIRSLIVAAGVLMNYLLAIVLLSVVSALGVRTAVDPSIHLPSYAVVGDPTVTVAAVEADSPADIAGIKPGDSIVAVDDKSVSEVSQTVEAITAKAGSSAVVEIQRGGERSTVQVSPRQNPPEGQGPVGVQLLATSLVKYPWYVAPYEGLKQTVFLTGQIVQSFGTMIGRLFTTGSVGADVAGPVGIAVLTGQVLDLGFVPLMQFVAILSVNLAIINLIPFPALDGGRLLFFAIEKVRRKKVSRRIENTLHTVGFGLLIALIVLITVRDVIKLL